MVKLAAIAAISYAALMASAFAQEAAPAAAAETEVLRGADAFGNWEADAPGTRRHITAEDIVAPGETESARNAPDTVERPADAVPVVPEGFRIELVAEGIANPRAIEFAPNGDLFIANSRNNEVLVLRPVEGQAAAEPTVFASEGLNRPFGIAFYPAENPEWIYVANTDGVVRFPYAEGDIEASAAPETIVSGIPTEGHWTRDVAFSPDGSTLYLSVGSDTNVGDDMERMDEAAATAWAADQPLGLSWGPEEGRATVLAFNPDGTDRRVFATGLRNCTSLAIHPGTGEPWCVVNERDALGDNVPFEYATSVKEGNFYGWPWYYIGGNPDPRWEGARADLAEQVTVPDVLMQAHSAPLGIAFYTSDAFGADYQGDAFVALHGSWNRDTRTGYKVVRLLFDDAGQPTGEYEDFITGFVISNEEVWGRPVGVAVDAAGALYIGEDGSGTLWKVTKE